MTYLEYITAILSKFGLSDDDIDFILVEADLTGSTEVTTAEDRIKLKTAIYTTLPRMIAGLSQEIEEGGYRVKWNIEGLKLWYSVLASELGLIDLLTAGPTVKDASFRW